MTRPGNDIKLNKKLANASWSKYDHIVYEPFVDVIADIIKDNNVRNIVEVGCGHGKIGYYLKKVFKFKKVKIVATEISYVAKKMSEKYYDKIYMKEDYKLPPGKFDLVLLTSIIEHIYDKNLKVLFKEIREKLVEEGKVFVVVPNIHAPKFILTDSKESQKRRMGHVNLKSKREWEEFFRKQGFTKFKYSFANELPNLNDMSFFKSSLGNKILRLVYRLLNIWPFFYLKNSYWIEISR